MNNNKFAGTPMLDNGTVTALKKENTSLEPFYEDLAKLIKKHNLVLDYHMPDRDYQILIRSEKPNKDGYYEIYETQINDIVDNVNKFI